VICPSSEEWSNVYCGLPVAVIGAAGFIGRAVAAVLSSRGAVLHLAVRNRAAAETLLADYSISGKLYEVDLLDELQVHSFVEQAGPAIIFNLAGYGVDRSEHDPELAHQLNSVLPVILGAAMVRHKPAWPGTRLVHVGSGIEYGRSACELRETSIPTAPDILYARTKLAGTIALERFCIEQSFSALTARLFTVYGPGEHPGRLLPSLLDAARRGTELLLTNGRQERDFTYVEDVAEGLLRLGVAHPFPAHGTVNLATGRMASVRQFAEIAADVLGIPRSRLRFDALPTRFDEMNYSGVSVERLRAMTGWTPAIDLVRGITTTVGFQTLPIRLNMSHAHARS
jgi:UDP-glucose 4-epimerase